MQKFDLKMIDLFMMTVALMLVLTLSTPVYVAAADSATLIKQYSSCEVLSAENARLQRLKTKTLEYYQYLMGDRDYEKASTYVGPNYIQHDPRISEDGFAALVQALETFSIWKDRPLGKIDFYNVVAEKDLVCFQLHNQRKNESGEPMHLLVIHLFRFDENEKIDEHWSAATAVNLSDTQNKAPLFKAR